MDDPHDALGDGHLHAGTLGQPDDGLLAAWRRMSEARRNSGVITMPADTPEDEPPSLPEKPSLAVLDFADLGSRPVPCLLQKERERPLDGFSKEVRKVGQAIRGSGRRL